jgi:polyisoprenoid-binding protein YceI
MRPVIKIAVGALCISLAVAACRSRPLPSGPPVGTEVPPLAAAQLKEGRVYRVVGDESLLQIQAFRGGTLARAGHNHVIASRHLNGEVRVPADFAQASFAITMPVALLTIDEPELRAAAGTEFASDVPDSAREGTRKNMLGEALLDGERYPGVELRSVKIEKTPTGFDATIAVTVKDKTTEHRVPLFVAIVDDRLQASGEFKLEQSALGLTPFSVMLGALAVQDELRVQFAIVARAAAT